MTAVKFKIRKGDTVIVRTGRDKGKKGEVLSVVKDDAKIFVKGINSVKRHTKATQTNAGGIVQKELPIHISNVALIDPKDGSFTKTGFKFQKDGTKVRYAKKSGETL
ncbi:MAG: 50S ribosomal protein L24 [Alphaproteobacteria bacterium]|jgi:large subunit ribosomal protein L24|nr:50S ribosomal protein L24 [Alphaproteobacteria bacterium]